jgi:hypothetical protein
MADEIRPDPKRKPPEHPTTDPIQPETMPPRPRPPISPVEPGERIAR